MVCEFCFRGAPPWWCHCLHRSYTVQCMYCPWHLFFFSLIRQCRIYIVNKWILIKRHSIIALIDWFILRCASLCLSSVNSSQAWRFETHHFRLNSVDLWATDPWCGYNPDVSTPYVHTLKSTALFRGMKLLVSWCVFPGTWSTPTGVPESGGDRIDPQTSGSMKLGLKNWKKKMIILAITILQYVL